MCSDRQERQIYDRKVALPGLDRSTESTRRVIMSFNVKGFEHQSTRRTSRLNLSYNHAPRKVHQDPLGLAILLVNRVPPSINDLLRDQRHEELWALERNYPPIPRLTFADRLALLREGQH